MPGSLPERRPRFEAVNLGFADEVTPAGPLTVRQARPYADENGFLHVAVNRISRETTLCRDNATPADRKEEPAPQRLCTGRRRGLSLVQSRTARSVMKQRACFPPPAQPRTARRCGAGWYGSAQRMAPVAN